MVGNDRGEGLEGIDDECGARFDRDSVAALGSRAQDEFSSGNSRFQFILMNTRPSTTLSLSCFLVSECRKLCAEKLRSKGH